MNERMNGISPIHNQMFLQKHLTKFKTMHRRGPSKRLHGSAPGDKQLTYNLIINIDYVNSLSKTFSFINIVFITQSVNFLSENSDK